MIEKRNKVSRDKTVVNKKFCVQQEAVTRLTLLTDKDKQDALTAAICVYDNEMARIRAVNPRKRFVVSMYV
jgi:hypothetical protein